MPDLKTELIKYFLDTKAFKHDPVTKFTLSSGEKSEFYVDCKEVVSDPMALAIIGRYGFERVRHLKFDCIGGLAIGSIAIATILSQYGARNHQPWPNFVVRKEAKAHGLEKKIEGMVRPGTRALIVDDVLTTGKSILQAVEAVRSKGLRVEHALVIVDRQEQNGQQNLEKEGLKLISLLTIKDLQCTESYSSSFN